MYSIYTGDESWIYAYESESKQQSTVWVFQDEPNPTKVVRARSTSKQMVACFFGKNGRVATVPLEDRRTANSEWYTIICLPEVFEEIRKNNQRRRIILHHDNASSHIGPNNIALIWHLMISFCSHTWRINYVANDFRRQNKRLMRSKCIFSRYLYRNGKSAMKIGSNVCKSVSIITENIWTNNKTIFNDKYLFLFVTSDT